MVKSIQNRNALTDEQKEEERDKTRRVRKAWRDKPTNGMTLEERIERLEIIIAGEE
jgi:hypothetical protein